LYRTSKGLFGLLNRALAADKVVIYYYWFKYRLKKRRSTTLNKVESKTKELPKDSISIARDLVGYQLLTASPATEPPH
jgi:hypothetical protein